jgi:hypothetical protein
MNAKHSVWNSVVSNSSDEKLLASFDISDFEISAPQYHTHYPPAANGDVLDIVVHQNVRLSEVTVSDVLDSDNISMDFHILELEISLIQLKNSQTGRGFKALPRI